VANKETPKPQKLQARRVAVVALSLEKLKKKTPATQIKEQQEEVKAVAVIQEAQAPVIPAPAQIPSSPFLASAIALNTQAPTKIEASKVGTDGFHQLIKEQTTYTTAVSAMTTQAVVVKPAQIKPIETAKAETVIIQNPPAQLAQPEVKPIQLATTEPGLINEQEVLKSVPSVSNITVARVAPALNTQTTQKIGYSTAEPQNPSTPVLAPAEQTKNLHGFASDSCEVSDVVEAPSSYKYVEAFDVAQEVRTASATILSYEGGAQNHAAHWTEISERYHWTTLTMARDSATGIPLLAENTIKMLSPLSTISQSKDAGIVLVKMQPSWHVKISARSESSILLTADGHPIEGQPDGIYYVLYQNVEPGAHLAHLTRKCSNDAGSVPFPVQAGNTTYLDLTHISKQNVEGYVLDASKGAQAKPLRGTQVQTADQYRKAFTDTQGHFALNSVVTVDGYPVVLETDATNAFTHRYQLNSNHLQNLTLFRFSVEQQQDWIGQLEGGLSPQSGLVIAALPEVETKHEGENLYPSVHPLQSNASLSTETYTLSQKGQLEVGRALDAGGRFISVQVSGGYQRAEVRNTGGDVVWSELLLVSPDVVNVVRTR
jgi:hypothetical protein